MRIGTIVLIGVGVLVAGGLIATPTILSLPHPPKRDALMGADFFRIRREALTLFPRGSRLSDTADALVAIGFRCHGVPHKIANVNAESLECESHGRGYPTSPALNITVMARNGLISDFNVWNILHHADAETPEPPPQVASGEDAAANHHEKPAKAE